MFWHTGPHNKPMGTGHPPRVVSINVGIVGIVGIDEGFQPFSTTHCRNCRNTRRIRQCYGPHVLFVRVGSPMGTGHTPRVVSINVRIVGIVGIDEGFRSFPTAHCRKCRNTRRVRHCSGIGTQVHIMNYVYDLAANPWARGRHPE